MAWNVRRRLADIKTYRKLQPADTDGTETQERFERELAARR